MLVVQGQRNAADSDSTGGSAVSCCVEGGACIRSWQAHGHTSEKCLSYFIQCLHYYLYCHDLMGSTHEGESLVQG